MGGASPSPAPSGARSGSKQRRERRSCGPRTQTFQKAPRAPASARGAALGLLPSLAAVRRDEGERKGRRSCASHSGRAGLTPAPRMHAAEEAHSAAFKIRRRAAVSQHGDCACHSRPATHGVAPANGLETQCETSDLHLPIWGALWPQKQNQKGSRRTAPPDTLAPAHTSFRLHKRNVLLRALHRQIQLWGLK